MLSNFAVIEKNKEGKGKPAIYPKQYYVHLNRPKATLFTPQLIFFLLNSVQKTNINAKFVHI
ncbi:hypothetical protein C7N43_14695 [Sphingobacteriales bacterium UPWRP_1]|nr:hypothetical protein BVG80_05075 [Sphingobacteriales bacterium TSM_CSM]PSJ76244.1 hypothetical protein C7N43_14695 [Sphingobacteriales bacterium UPWRP_1]